MKRILIVDDHEVVREGLMRILGEHLSTTRFGQAGSVSEALALARAQAWDLAILDISLVGRDGLELLKELKKIRPRLPVLVLSIHAEEQYARRAFKSGAAGYITKDSPTAEFIKAVKKVLKGGKYISPALAERLVGELADRTDRPLHETLSDREFEILRLIASGKTVGQIAQELALSVNTVSTYRARVLDKMGLKTNAELTHYAIQNRLVD